MSRSLLIYAPVLALLVLMASQVAAQRSYEDGLFGPSTGADAAAEFYERALVEYNLGNLRPSYVYLRSALRQDPLMLPPHLLLAKIYLASGQGERAEKQLLIADGLGAHRALTQNSLARAYLMQGKAAELLEKLFPLGSAPEEDAELLALRGEAHLQLEQLFDAQRAFMQAWDKSSTSASAILGRIQVLLSQGAIEEAHKLAQEAVETASSNPRVWYLKGLLANALGDYTGALADLDRAVELQPAYLPAQLLRLDILIRLQRFDEASSAAIGIREIFPNDPRGYLVEAVVRARRGELDTAQTLLEDAATLLSRFPRELIEGHPPTLLLAGIVNFNLKRWQLARDFLTTYLSKYPAAVGPRVLLARIELDQEQRPEQAIKLLEPTLDESPKNVQLLSLLAEAYIRTAQHLRAAEVLRRALHQEQQDLMLRAQNAVNDYGLGRHTQAIETLGQVLSQTKQIDRAGASRVIMLARQGRYQEALEAATDLVADSPGHLSSLNLYGVVALTAGELEPARWAFSLALLLDPDFYPARQNLAELALLDGAPEEAARQIRIVLSERSRDIPALLVASRIAKTQGDGDRALKLAEKAVQIDPGVADAAILLSTLLLERRDVDAATDVIEATLRRAGTEENYTLLLALARAHLSAGRTGPAQLALRRASGLVGYETALLLDIAERQTAIGDREGALHSLRKAVRGVPSLQARIRLGEALIEHGQIDEAKTLAADLDGRFPNEPYADHLLGLLYLSIDDPNAALASFESALRKRPSSLLAVRVYEAKRAADGVDAANAYLAEWLAEHPRDVVSIRSLAQGYFGAGRVEEARALFEQAAEQGAEDPLLLNNLALVYAETGDPRAEDYARRALELDPDSPQIIDTLGWVLTRSGARSEGLKHLREARARGGDDPSIAYHLAVALHELGRRDEAEKTLREALRSHDRFPERSRARQLLDQLRAAEAG